MRTLAGLLPMVLSGCYVIGVGAGPVLAASDQPVPENGSGVGTTVEVHATYGAVAQLGFAARAKIMGELLQAAVGPEGCLLLGASTSDSERDGGVLIPLCVGAHALQLDIIEGEFGVGTGSPFFAPAVMIPVGVSTKDRLVLHAVRIGLTAEWNVRPSARQPSSGYLGLHIGYGALVTDVPHQILDSLKPTPAPAPLPPPPPPGFDWGEAP